MKEQDLIDLGFERNDVSEEDFGKAFYYYDLDLVPGFGLISNASDEVVDGKWYVEFFEADRIVFVDREQLEEFINIVKRNIKS